MTTLTANAADDNRTVYPIILCISLCHLSNDMMQSLLPAIYPTLKAHYALTFGELGWITLAYQVTASLLQPIVGHFADRRPAPYSLPLGTLFTVAGLLVLASAQSYVWMLGGACLLGLGSSVFHPESSRVARMAAGGRYALSQSLFQLGGNAGAAIGPLAAALIVAQRGQPSLRIFALLTLISTALLWRVGWWYQHRGLQRLQVLRSRVKVLAPLPRTQAFRGLGLLLVLIFSRYVYVASLTNYFTFYLIERFHVSVVEAQVRLFVFLAALAAGTLIGGPVGDRIGRKTVILGSIVAALPFTLLLPFASLLWTTVLSVFIGVLLAGAFPSIVVLGQELFPHRVGTVSGLLFGFSFGIAGLGAAVLGAVADARSIAYVYEVCAFLPVLGLAAWWLPEPARRRG